MSLYIAPAAMGLSDLVVALPVVQSQILQGENVYLVVRAAEHLPLAKRISGLAGAILEWELNTDRLRTHDSFYDLRDHYLQRRYWWGSREFEQAYPGYKINDILAVICGDLGLEVDFKKLQPLMATPREGASGAIAFIPGSSIEAKCWEPERWMELAQRLEAQGRDVIVVGDPTRFRAVAHLQQQGLPVFSPASTADALDVLSGCGGVVSVDTGLMHLAVHQSIPTVGIFRNHPVYLRTFSHFHPLISKSVCTDACYLRETQCIQAHHTRAHSPSHQKMTWTCQAPSRKHCLSTIEVQDAFAAITALIKHVPIDMTPPAKAEPAPLAVPVQAPLSTYRV